MNYFEAIDYIKNVEKGGSDYGIERMRLLLDALGSPDDKLKFVHIAGTDGKGSVSAFLTNIFMAAGLKTGTYNSPSVFTYEERWKIENVPIDKDLFAKCMTEVRAAAEENNLKPTAFEMETAVGMLAFLKTHCDIVVLETGLGGRWDATNAIKQKEVAVITSIGFDHCALLGNTLFEIAGEKAAIIKDAAVTFKQCDEIMQAIYSPYKIVDGKKEHYFPKIILSDTAELETCDLSRQTFTVNGEIYEIKLLGLHQLENASLAIKTAEYLSEKGYKISREDIKRGLKNTKWAARFEVVKDAKERFNLNIPHDKVLVLDGAHNPHGAKALRRAIETYFAGKKITMVMGMLKDKDVSAAVKEIAPLATKVYAVTPPSVRAMKAEEIKKIIEKYTSCDVANSVREGVEKAANSDADAVIVCGSLTLFQAL